MWCNHVLGLAEVLETRARIQLRLYHAKDLEKWNKARGSYWNQCSKVK
jgi:hypothetical protein